MTPSEDMWKEVQPGQDRGVRAGDEDREAVATILLAAHHAGRLDADELHDRLDCCYRARTLADLDSLVDDLPRGASSHDPARPASGRSRVRRLLPLAVLIAAVAVVCAVTGEHAVWAAVPLAFIGFRVMSARYLRFARHGWG